MSIDPHSATWRTVREHAEKAMQSATATVCAHGHDVASTEYERGKIKALRDILALEPKPDA